MSRQKVLDVGAFYVATGNGHGKGTAVAIEFDHDRKTLSREGPWCAATYSFMCDRAWSWEEVPMSRPDILGRD